MVRNASRALKIGVHLPFGPNFDVANRTFYPEKFRLAYCAVGCHYEYHYISIKAYNTPNKETSRAMARFIPSIPPEREG